MGCQSSADEYTTVQQPHRLTERHKRTQLIDPRKRSTKFSDIITQNVTIIRNTLQQQERAFALKYLSNHDFFSTLSQPELQEILQAMILGQTNQGQYVFDQGDFGNCFFLILQGQVEVIIDGQHIRTLDSGKSFGELALLFRTSRTASIKAIGPKNVMFIIKPALLRECLKKMALFELEKNRKMIDTIQIFHGLTNKQRQLLSKSLKPINFNEGETIFNVGMPADLFYIIWTGQVDIDIPGKDLITLRDLDSFGESCFKPNSKRLGTAVAKQKTSTSVLSKNDVSGVFGKMFDNIFFFNLQKWAIMRSDCFKLDSSSITTLISKFSIKQANEGDILVESEPSGFIINLEGTMNGKSPGALFGQKTYKKRSVLSNPIVKNDTGHYAYISYDDVDKTLRQIQAKKICAATLETYSKKNIPSAIDKQNMDLFNLTAFQFLKQLGQGQFGKVYLVRNDAFGGNLYAIKCLSKQQIRKEAMESCVIQEKRILSKIVFPYIVGFAQAFHDQKNIYFLMQYIKGKQLFDVIREMPYLNKAKATYFFACLFLSVEHLHKHNIIYRDIKPQNSVVDYTGKTFLIDLGTAKTLRKESFYRTFTMIGTPHYMAPQILDGKGYSFEVDIWSMGVILYEFVCGHLPFGQSENDPYIVMKKVRTDKIQYSNSPQANQDFKDVISLLLEKSPKVRSIKATFQAVKKCEYFSQLNWEELLKQKVTPPYIPKSFRNVTNHENTMKMDSKPLGQFLYGRSIIAKKWKVQEWDEKFTTNSYE